MVIQLQPDNAMAYYIRATVWLYVRAWKAAKADLTTANALGLDIASLFFEEHESVLEFQWRIGIQLPADIAEMLTPA